MDIQVRSSPEGPEGGAGRPRPHHPVDGGRPPLRGSSPASRAAPPRAYASPAPQSADQRPIIDRPTPRPKQRLHPAITISLSVLVTLLVLGGVATIVYFKFLRSRLASSSTKAADTTSTTAPVDYQTFNDKGVTFQYPKTFAPKTVNTSDPTTAGIITEQGQSNPESLITVSLVKNADKNAAKNNLSAIDYLDVAVAASLPKKYTGYQKQNDDRVKVDGFNAISFKFTYTGKDKVTPVYVALLSIPRNHDSYYVTIESISQSMTDTLLDQLRSSLMVP